MTMYECDCNQWMALNEGDRAISRVLECRAIEGERDITRDLECRTIEGERAITRDLDCGATQNTKIKLCSSINYNT